MKFTFGIITGGNDEFVNKVIDSIEKQNIPEYEVIVVGGNSIDRNNIKHISFDERQRRMWITKKKNLVTKNAKYDNVVYMHDYVVLFDNWYNGYLEFGDDFKVCMNQIKNSDGERYRDWVLWCRDLYPAISKDVTIDEIQNIIKLAEFILPYDITHLSKYMYFSGTYWVAKRDVMLEFPLNESRLWGQGEDIIWSRIVRRKYDFSMNANSTVKFLKFKEQPWNECSDETIEILKKMK